MARAPENHGPTPALTPGAAFVVHLAVHGSTGSPSERGRVEHVLTGNATQFESIADLVAFMEANIADRQGFHEEVAPAETADGQTPSARLDSS